MPWDEPLPNDLLQEWQCWLSDLEKLAEIKQTRLVGTTQQGAKLAIFADASKAAYGCCVYLVTERGSSLLFSKTRVAPIKGPKLEAELSIARLELLASLIATRIADYVTDAFEKGTILETLFFTDSLITLYRIRNGPERYKIWVANRVREIRDRSAQEQWYFVPGQLNPADLASRSATASELQENSLWWKGPAFLLLERSKWPIHKALTRSEAWHQNELDEKEKKADLPIAICWPRKEEHPLEKLVEKVTSWAKLLRIVAWMFRMVTRKNGQSRGGNCLKITEIRKAETVLIKYAQASGFPEEEKELEGTLIKWKPFKDQDGVWRATTRLEASEMLYSDTVNPILLPKANAISEKFVMNLHEIFGHAGPAQTLYHVRKHHRLVGGKREVRRILNKCIRKSCRKIVPAVQNFAPLPPERIDAGAPWQRIGVDFFGPLKVKHTCSIKDCSHPQEEKGWGCLFTCFLTRAVHVELCENMSTSTFLLAFTRLCNRRGVPDYVWSDNARTYKAASRALMAVYASIDWKEVQDSTSKRKIQWEFGIALAPWTNGLTERMVQSVKIALKRTYGDTCLRYDELESALVEAEGIVNDRPIAAVSEDEDDPGTITPSMLCIGRPIQGLPFDERNLSAQSLEKQPVAKILRIRKQLALQFWRTWRRDYLLNLQATNHSKAEDYDLKVNQIVFLKEENLAKGKWRLAKITDFKRGRDGKIRRVTLTINESSPATTLKTTTVERHVNMLGLLEGAPLLAHQISNLKDGQDAGQ